MKKLVHMLALGAVIAALAGCHSAGTKTEEEKKTAMRPAIPANIVVKTLDGVDSINAVKDINYFENNSTTPGAEQIRSFLVKSDMVVKISNLLQAELKAQTNAGWKHVTDGVRIYLAMDPSNPTAPVSLLFVSTLDSVNQATGKKGYHHDYYSHSASAGLFSGSTPAVVPENTPSASTGALLYGDCLTMAGGCAIDATCVNVVNIHFTLRQFAENMVKKRKSVQRAFNMHSEWFDLDIIKKLASDTKLSALRIYFGTHPDNDPSVGYQKKDAFVITTTQLQPGTNNYVDYFDCSTMQNLLSLPQQRLDNVQPLDKGELCPENCNIDSGAMDFLRKAKGK